MTEKAQKIEQLDNISSLFDSNHEKNSANKQNKKKKDEKINKNQGKEYKSEIRIDQNPQPINIQTINQQLIQFATQQDIGQTQNKQNTSPQNIQQNQNKNKNQDQDQQIQLIKKQQNNIIQMQKVNTDPYKQRSPFQKQEDFSKRYKLQQQVFKIPERISRQINELQGIQQEQQKDEKKQNVHIFKTNQSISPLKKQDIMSQKSHLSKNSVNCQEQREKCDFRNQFQNQKTIFSTNSKYKDIQLENVSDNQINISFQNGGAPTEIMKINLQDNNLNETEQLDLNIMWTELQIFNMRLDILRARNILFENKKYFHNLNKLDLLSFVLNVILNDNIAFILDQQEDIDQIKENLGKFKQGKISDIALQQNFLKLTIKYYPEYWERTFINYYLKIENNNKEKLNDNQKDRNNMIEEARQSGNLVDKQCLKCLIYTKVEQKNFIEVSVKCDHFYCEKCLQAYLAEQVQQVSVDNILKIKCPYNECFEYIKQNTVGQNLPNEIDQKCYFYKRFLYQKYMSQYLIECTYCATLIKSYEKKTNYLQDEEIQDSIKDQIKEIFRTHKNQHSHNKNNSAPNDSVSFNLDNSLYQFQMEMDNISNLQESVIQFNSEDLQRVQSQKSNAQHGVNTLKNIQKQNTLTLEDQFGQISQIQDDSTLQQTKTGVYQTHTYIGDNDINNFNYNNIHNENLGKNIISNKKYQLINQTIVCQNCKNKICGKCHRKDHIDKCIIALANEYRSAYQSIQYTNCPLCDNLIQGLFGVKKITCWKCKTSFCGYHHKKNDKGFIWSNSHEQCPSIFDQIIYPKLEFVSIAQDVIQFIPDDEENTLIFYFNGKKMDQINSINYKQITSEIIINGSLKQTVHVQDQPRVSAVTKYLCKKYDINLKINKQLIHKSSKKINLCGQFIHYFKWFLTFLIMPPIIMWLVGEGVAIRCCCNPQSKTSSCKQVCGRITQFLTFLLELLILISNYMFVIPILFIFGAMYIYVNPLKIKIYIDQLFSCCNKKVKKQPDLLDNLRLKEQKILKQREYAQKQSQNISGNYPNRLKNKDAIINNKRYNNHNHNHNNTGNSFQSHYFGQKSILKYKIDDTQTNNGQAKIYSGTSNLHSGQKLVTCHMQNTHQNEANKTQNIDNCSNISAPNYQKNQQLKRNSNTIQNQNNNNNVFQLNQNQRYVQQNHSQVQIQQHEPQVNQEQQKPHHQQIQLQSSRRMLKE